MARNQTDNKATTAQSTQASKETFTLTKEGRKPWKTTDRAEVVNLLQRGWKVEQQPKTDS